MRVAISLHDVELTANTLPDLFSPKGFDKGSELLVRTLIEKYPSSLDKAQILDWGCGWGAISLVLAKKYIDSHITAIDSDIGAVRAAQDNASANRLNNMTALASYGYDELHKEKIFDTIVSNPPTHRGREIVETMISESHHRLAQDGLLGIVVEARLKPWVQKALQKTFGNCKIANRSNKHVVLVAQKK